MEKRLDFWYYSTKRYEHLIGENAGDIFGAWLFNKLGYTLNYTEAPKLVTAGSILTCKWLNGNNTICWGSGMVAPKYPIVVKKENIMASRGKLTNAVLGIDVPVGDPGLLASKFFTPTTEQRDVGIISHYVDEDYFKLNYNDKFKLISMIVTDTNTLENIFNEIASCKFIFSSSLHGIIFSHSFGVPAIHLENKPLYSGTNFKFEDYYSVFDSINYTKETVDTIDFNKYLMDDKSKYLPYKEELNNIQSGLLKSLNNVLNII